MFSKVANYAGLAFALLCLSSVHVEAATHPQDIEALWRFKEEALKMSNNDARWRKVVSAGFEFNDPYYSTYATEN